ncbi:MAG: S-layer homology domain-containing protein [Clostridiales bacterium]|nr:S-layer homology domain-containing protein [Clostridiales bacterium]
MRNLKKFLALILAMMMAFSLMVTANAKGATVNEKGNGTNQYTDAQTIDKNFVEAVDVLYGMGVMTGDYGAFKGDQFIMRSEMAAVLYRLMTGDTTQLKNQLYADQAADRFKDVPANAWYAPYVGWCYNAGIMVGSNGYFRPTANVTGNETLVMVLRAMGYGKNHEYTGATWTIYAQRDGTQIGLLKDVTNSHYASNLAGYSRRDVVASIVFQGAQLPTVTYTPSLGYNQYIGVASAQGGNILNPSLGMTNFGLTSHVGIVLGNKATGEGGDYPTKIGFSVNPTISKGLNVGDDLATGLSPIINGTLTAAEITDVVDDAAYQYVTSSNVDTVNNSGGMDAQNVTLSFDWDTDLDLFGHKVKVWYDCRGHAVQPVTLQGTNYNTSTVNFGTNNTTYALYDQARAKVVAASNADLTAMSNEQLGKVADDNGFTNNNVFFNYAFSRMPATRTTSTTKVSPINSNNEINGLTTDTDAWPLYVLIDNGNTLDVVISLELTISQVVQDNDTVDWLTTGILTQNGPTGTPYFDTYDVVDPAATGDNSPLGGTAKYSKMANDNMVDSDDIKLRDYVAAVAVTGTTGANMGSTNTPTDSGNATVRSGKRSTTTSTYYYKVDQLVTKVTKTLWKYDQNTQECFFADGSSLKKSIYANAVDGSFKANQFVNAPHDYRQDYTFYLDREGDYLFWEIPSATSSFVYGTYIDWETKLASGEFIYPLVYVDAQGKDHNDHANANITKVENATPTAIGDMGVKGYGDIILPKRDIATSGNVSGFVKGTYVGYSLDSNGVLNEISNIADRNTGFWQADTDNFGTATSTTVINTTGVAIGAVPVANADAAGAIYTAGTYNNDHLFFTNSTKFVVVTGAGTATQKATVYNGLAEFLGDGNVSVKIDATTLRNTTTLAGPYLDETGVVATDPYKLVYYSLSSETYDQIYDPSARVVDTVFIPDVMVTRTPSVSGDLYFVGNNAASIINATDNATLYTMYKDGVKGDYWIDGLLDRDDDSDADTVDALGQNVFYQLVDAGRTAYDGGKVYKLLAMSATTANNTIIGQYYGTSTTTADTTTRMANAALTLGYLATTQNAQAAFIGGRTGNDLFNVVGANVTNLYNDYTIDNLAQLNGTSSLTSNMGVDVSCVLGNANNVTQIYVNTLQTAVA